MEAGDRMRTPRVLSIAGSDPSGGAGIQADLKSIAANGGYGMAAVTALTAQNTIGVRSVFVPPATFLAEQLDAVSDDIDIDAVKIGMLANTEIIATVSRWLDRVRPAVVVLDPVMIATSGDRLLDADAEAGIRELAGRADVITPNVPELAVLAGGPVAQTWADALAQARRVAAKHAVRVLAKGGHLAGDEAPDALVEPDGTTTEFPGRRIDTTSTHGTGCSLSSAVATLRPRSDSWTEAIGRAKEWLTESIRHGAELRVGAGNGPISHFAGLWARGGIESGVGRVS
jgi:hydroxymethylpyrimidine/phosphomethylpyrimidine kinase